MKKYYQGSYTIEASLIMPFLLLIMIATIDIAINYHEEIKEVAKEEEVEEIPIVKMFYQTEFAEEWIKGVLGYSVETENE